MFILGPGVKDFLLTQGHMTSYILMPSSVCTKTSKSIWHFQKFSVTSLWINLPSWYFMLCNRCKFEDILLEMDRILRPEGAVIIRDKVDALVKVEKIANAMRWKTRLADHESGPHVPEKILFAVKRYWVVANKSS